MNHSSAAGFYIHVPFCRAKCVYCDFNSYANCQPLFTPYLEAVHKEMARIAPLVSNSPLPKKRTLYIGGGTPTILPARELAELVRQARYTFDLPADAEITVEANPGTINATSLRTLYAAGVSRLSIGIQSFDDELLHALGRIHTAQEAIQAVQDARTAGLENLNLDLMFGLPGQTLDTWQKSIQQAVKLLPQHLSLYALTIEHGTPLANRVTLGEILPPDDDLAADMYEWAEEYLEQIGYIHYEISNWALPGHECQHNLVYWHNDPYFGLGAGAHSWSNGERWANLDTPGDYIAAIEEGRLPVKEREAIDLDLEMGETMMMGLRLLQEGVSRSRFETRFGTPIERPYAAEIPELVAQGLIEFTYDRIRLTKRGHLLGNQVFAQFLSDR
ncbi:MAG: radical SAM family heme chaperone HemW [Anaerolineae bacterium]|nr:radical SAM family heme chaperone HemW [Anaerolineae bacterium]